MTIRIFNPEHDLALASGLEHFTSPHAGRQLRSDLSFLPALWSEDGDVVLVDDIDAAETEWQRVRFVNKNKVEFCTKEQLPAVLKAFPSMVNGEYSEGGSFPMGESGDRGLREALDAWGMDQAIRFQLLDAGIPETVLPSKENIAEIKDLSSRKHTSTLLPLLREGLIPKTCGESYYCESEGKVREFCEVFGDIVVKAPWSSSGRGVRYLPQSENLTTITHQPSPTTQHPSTNTWNWIRNTIRQQGGVMVEPYYNKVKDFGMELEATKEGRVEYRGLSLFETKNGAYTGNLLISEEEKLEKLTRYVRKDLISEIIKRLEFYLSKLINKRYVGALGVDMMIVSSSECFLLHPCVEINLRRTMGHVALAITDRMTIPQGIMQVTYEQKKYHLRLKRLDVKD